MHEKDAGVGATRTDVPKHKCSIKKVTVSTSWKAPNKDVPEDVEAVVFDKSISNKGKTIYLISSPKGKNVTIKVDREEGSCPSPIHKRYEMTYPGCQDEDEGTNTEYIQYDTKNEISVNIKCFEIDISEGSSLRYWLKLPISIEEMYFTIFNHYSCKERFNYQIVSYPDISFKLVLSISKSNEKNKYYPTLVISVKANGKSDKLEVKIDSQENKELITTEYIKNNQVKFGFGINNIQQIDKIKKILELADEFKMICNKDFIKEFLCISENDIFEGKFIKKEPIPTNASLTIESKYRTSKDLTQIGKCTDVVVACNPLIGIKVTIDLLYIAVSLLSGGTLNGVYVLANFFRDQLINEYGEIPLDADIYCDLVVSGSININFHHLFDSIVNAHFNTSFDLTINIDINAGAKASIQVFYFVAAAIDLSISLNTAFILKIEIDNRKEEFDCVKEGTWVFAGAFINGLKIKTCATASVGLFKIINWTPIGTEKESTIWEPKDLFSKTFGPIN